MPKPDLVALTGGYRRTPVLQLGCDVYCVVIERAGRVLVHFPRYGFRIKTLG